MKKQIDNQAERLINTQRRHDRLRRAIALLSAVVMLLTMSSLKMSADTLERIPMCGIHEHVHTQACYSRNGTSPACGMEEHVHTDACFQQRPLSGPAATRMDGFIALSADVNLTSDISVIEEEVADVAAAEISQQGLVEEADEEPEVDDYAGLELGENGLETAPESEQQDIVEELPVESDADAYSRVYSMEGQASVQLSRVLYETGLELDIETVTGVTQVLEAEDAEPVVAVEPVEGDYIITPVASFDAVELAIFAGEDIHTVKLVKAVVETADDQEEETTEEDGEGETATEDTEEDKKDETIIEGAEDETDAEDTEDTEDDTAIEGTEDTETVEADVTAVVEDTNVTIVAVGENSLPADSGIVYNENINREAAIDELNSLLGMSATSGRRMMKANRAMAAQVADAAPEVQSDYAVFDISILADGGEYSETGEVEVTVRPDDVDMFANLPEGAQVVDIDYTLYHVHEGQVETLPVQVDAENGVIRSVSFNTASFSNFILKYDVKYTVEYEIVNGEVTVKVDFTDIVQNGVDFDQNDVITALNDGVGVSIAELEQGYTEGTDNVVYGELSVDYTTADNKDSLVQKSWGLMDVVSADDGLTVENGEIRVTADGTVVLSDGESTINIKITGYQASVQKVLGDGATIEALGDTELPMGASASYEDLSEKADELAETYNLIPEQTEEEKKEIGFSAFDVAVTVPSDDYVSEGSFAVTVPHTLDVEVPENAKVTYELFHIHEVDGEIKAELVENATFEDGKVSFVTDGFSEYVVRYTVDFEYEINGKMYDFSIPGGGFITLKNLIEALGIISDDEQVDIDQFVADIQNVEFSNPELVWVGKVDADMTLGMVKSVNGLEIEYSSELTEEAISHINDEQLKAGEWVLISLKAFESEETLTVTMKDGEVWTVKVTDAQITRDYIDAKGDTWEITVTYEDDAEIPENAELKVREILPEDAEYEDYYQQSLEMVGVVETEESETEAEEGSEDESAPTVASGYARIFDIQIWADGQEIQPASDVSVSIKLLDAPKDENTNLQVVHFGKDGLEVMALTAGEEEDETKAAGIELYFVTDEFSVYSVVNVTSSTDLVSTGPFALVTGIAGDPGATTGYHQDWGQDYFTIIVNANAMEDGSESGGLSAEGVHAWTDSTGSYVGGGVTQWYFEKQSGTNAYKIYTYDTDGVKRYVAQGMQDWGGHWNYNQQVSITPVAHPEWATTFTVTPQSDGTVLISNDSWYLHNNQYGNNEWSGRNYIMQYNPSSTDLASSAYRFRLCKESDDFEPQAAKKVSASTITTNANYVIYRKFEDAQGNESLYALAHDGTFVRVYDGGDTIYWRETDKNIYWNYQMDGNYPVLFTQNPTTHETIYINPNHSTGQTLSTTAGGLTLIGKDNGEYSTAIECWDQTAYDYAGLHVTQNNDGTASLSTGTRVAGTSDEFLFAVASTYPGATKETVDTVDSDSLGIKITMFDYGDWDGNYNAGDKLSEMTDIAGSAEYTPHAAHALVKPYLESGLPSGTAGAMTGLFSSGGAIKSSMSNVNHLFLQSYYDESSTFRYRSEDNYAYLPFSNGQITGTDFTVYRQAATPYTSDNSPGHTYYHHGHFMPFNDIDMNNNLSRLMNQYGNEYTGGTAVGEIPIGDGRTYEDIYGVVGTPNFYTGMKMEANFSQPRNGKLKNGDEMIFKFTGDDDMWVYIDGILVLDIGGIHEPLSGTINFATGKVTNPAGSSLAGTKTLYQIFQDVLTASGTPQEVKDKINSITWKDVDGDGTPDTFADYTNHSFSAFYMERGAGASNLDIQFNLKVVLTKQFTVEKEIPEDVDDRFDNQVYKFRATYMEGSTEKPLHANIANVCGAIVYRGTNDPVSVDENGYFYLRAGEAAVFMMADESIRYNVKEVDLDQYNLEKITINGDEVTEHVEINDQQATIIDNAAVAGYDEVGDRSNVLYTNYPKTQNLLITKHISEDSAPLEEGENPVFEFRVYLESTEVKDDGTTERKLVPYSYGPYYLTKEVEGETHYFTLTGVNNAPVDKGTTPVVCSTTGRSGSINSIPPEYTIVIPNLVVGTNFYVEERFDNIPEGYEFVSEDLKEGTYDENNLGTTAEIIDHVLPRDQSDHQEFDPKTVGRIKQDVDAECHVYNRKPAVIITVQKAWDPEPTAGTTVTVELHRYAKITKGTISVTLYDNNEAPVEGAVFELYKDGVATGTEVTTNVNGIASVSGLEAGSYKLVQKSTPAGYSMDGHTTETGTLTVVDNVTTPQTLSESLTNTALVTAGKVTLTLTDSGAGSGTSGTPIVGATYALYKDGSAFKTGLTTNSEGKVVVGNLAAGEYYLVQTATTAEYNLPNVTKTAKFTVVENPGVTQEFTQSMTNSLKGKGTVSLALTKEGGGGAVSGASFQLKSGNTVLETKQTGTDGTLTFDTVLYEGIYTVHQADTGSAGDDYATAADQTVTIQANSVTTQQQGLSFVSEEASIIYTLTLRSSSDNLSVSYNYKRGTVVTLTFDNGNDYYDPYDGIVLSGDVSGTISGHSSSFTVTMNSDKTITLTSTGYSNWNNVVTNALKLSPASETGTRSSARRSASLQSTSGLRTPSAPLLSTTVTGQTITHTNASPASAPAGYAEDSTFEVIEVTLPTSDGWQHTFDAQEQYDTEGNPYYYYIVETACSDSDYWIDSYSGDPLDDAGTITVTNKKDKKGNLTVTKQLLGEVTGNEDKAFKVTIKNSDNLYLQADGSFSEAEYEFSVSASNSLEITGIATGNYTVTEKTAEGDVAIEGYLWNVEESTASGTGEVTYNGTATVELKNYYDEIYTPVPSDVNETTDLVIDKDWANADGSTTPADTDTIKFKVKVKSADAYIPVEWNLYDAGATTKNTARSSIWYVQNGKRVTFTLNRFDEYVASGGGVGKNNTSFAVSSNVPLYFTGGTGVPQNFSDKIPIPSNANTGGKNQEGKTFARYTTVDGKEIIFESQPIWPGSVWVEGTPSAAHQWSFGLTVEDNAYYTSVGAMRDALIDDNATIEELVYTLDSTGVHIVENETTCNVRPTSATALNWVATLTGLPTYSKIEKDGVTSYKVYTYEIVEIEVNGQTVTNNRTDDYIVSTSTAGTTTTITNTEIKKVSADATKAWLNADNSTTPPTGATVTFELFANGEATGKTVILDGVTLEAEINADDTLTADEKAAAIAALPQEESGEFTAWKAEWRNLPQYSDDAQTQAITYTVKEVSGYTGHTNQNPDGVASGGTITNKQDTVSIEIVKVQKNAPKVNLPGAVFTLRQITDSEPGNGGEYYSQEGTTPKTSNPTAEGTGKTSFTGLTDGYYELKESTAPKGYVLTGQTVTYFKISGGVLTWLEKGSGKPSTWEEKTSKGDGELYSYMPAVAENPENEVAAQNAVFVVENEPGVALPSTGGHGTTLYTVAGLSLITLAGMMLWLEGSKKRRRPRRRWTVTSR